MNLPKNYEPKQYEDDIYALWEKNQAFKPREGDEEDKKGKGEKTYSIVMPPPNANANLHIGYALTAALEDIAARYHRMKGDSTLLLPGADHAGFETQSVYEKHLAKAGKSRFDFKREELYQQIWDFVAQNRGNFETQIRKFGVSCDWSKFTFTLDEKIVDRAYKTFKKMWDDGLIYRGERLVNYCTYHGTGFADIEVEYKDKVSPLYYLKYGPFEVATTRPETTFGDVAVAVHPEDERYKQYVDQVISVDGLNGPMELRVVADKMVDPNFGTGAVKITPSHDFNDYEVAQRHNLQGIRVINHDGTMNHKAGKYQGQPVKDARKAVVADLKARDLLAKTDHDYTNRVAVCYKCGTAIEPMLMEQWFVNMKPLAQEAIEALENGKIVFHPIAKREQLIEYLKGLRDWNISRQIAWGIPIPAFQNVDDSDDWIFDDRVKEEIIEVDNKTYRRDSDVFDTWFSSSSWPYAALDYPGGEDFAKFYPNGLMETGGEILYPWVSRMIMLGLYVTKEVPFKEVYIHGYVMAEDGSKMSKSLGNVVDPIPVIEKYGSDALRMGIISGRSPAVNRGYDERRIEEARNFCNKLWNVARYIESQLGEEISLNKLDVLPKTTADHWILSRLDLAGQAITDHLEAYRFSEAYERLYHLIWDDLADWYVEASKGSLNKSVINFALQTTLKLAHPFAPFVTETIWQTLQPNSNDLLISSKWPGKIDFSKTQADEFEKVIAIVNEIRQVKTLLGLKGRVLEGSADSKIIKNNEDLIKLLAGLDEIITTEVTPAGLQLVSTTENCWLDLSTDEIANYSQKLRTKAGELESKINNLNLRLSNQAYIKKAPKKLVQESAEQLEKLKSELSQLTLQLESHR